MKRLLGIALPVIAVLVFAAPAMAAPNNSASNVASCAASGEGQHVVQCAQTMEQGVSTCARAE